MVNFKFLPHTADIKFQAFGLELEDCFKNASYSVKDIISKDKIKNIEKKKINVKGKDFESLLYNFLEEFLVLFDSEGFLLGKVEKIEIDKDKFKLKADVSGDNAKNYEIESHVKAITYSEMFVKKENHKWICQVVVDV